MAVFSGAGLAVLMGKPAGSQGKYGRSLVAMSRAFGTDPKDVQAVAVDLEPPVDEDLVQAAVEALFDACRRDEVVD